MNSLQSKMILTLVVCMIASFAAIMVANFGYLNRVMSNDSSLAMEIALNELAENVNLQVIGVEQSTETMSEYVKQSLEENPAIFRTQESIAQFLEAFRDHADYDADNTYGAITSYFVLNPYEYGVRRGFFLTREDLTGSMEATEMTDILAYAEDDLEHVGWYYIPVKKGAPMWMSPYLNENINTWMTSYVVPLFDKSGNTVGVTGMDLDFNLIQSLVNDAYVFSDNGFAALFDSDGTLLLRADHGITLGDDPSVIKREKSDSTRADSQETRILREAAMSSVETGQAKTCTLEKGTHRVLARELENGMTLVAVVPESDIMAPIWGHLAVCAGIAAAVMLLSVIIAVFVTRSVTRPLRKLAIASQQISDGNLNVNLDISSKDEVGQLAVTFKGMADELKARMHEIQQQALIDPLTGIGNRAAYSKTTDVLRNEIADGTANFTLVVLDLNGLKHVNDTDGHKAGDALIADAANAIASVFGESRSYRYGGDEFAAILIDADLNSNDHWSTMIKEAIERINADRTRKARDSHPTYSGNLSIAWGIVTYDPQVHATYEDVFNEADRQMYLHKSEHR